jgi:hypothetical protein
VSRPAVVLFAAFAVVLPPGAASAKAVIPANSQLVAQTTLDPRASDTANNWHSKVLDPELEYTVVVSGTITEPYDATTHRTYDALYCYGSGEGDTRCGKASGSPQRHPAVLFNAGPSGRTTEYDGIDTLAGNRGQIPLQSDHEYDAGFAFKLVPGGADDYRLYAHTILDFCNTCTGSFHVQVYAPAVSTHGTVKLTFLQSGLPRSHSEDLHRSTTSGNGTLRLTGEPNDRGDYLIARVVPKGGVTILHTDDFVTGDDVGVILGVIDGSYVIQPGKGEILHLTVEVVTSSDPECPEGTRGRVNLFEPVAGSRASPGVAMQLCPDHKHVFKRFKSGGTVRIKIVRHRAPANARLL